MVQKLHISHVHRATPTGGGQKKCNNMLSVTYLLDVSRLHYGELPYSQYLTTAVSKVTVLHLGLEGCSQPGELWFVDILMVQIGTYGSPTRTAVRTVHEQSVHYKIFRKRKQSKHRKQNTKTTTTYESLNTCQ